MNAKVIDFAQSREMAPDDMGGLNAHLTQLIGEPFQFMRVSYGDELTIHFGNLRPARSPKLPNKFYGEYVLGMRASRWSIKGGKVPLLLSSGMVADDIVIQGALPIAKEELEKKPFVEPRSLVLTVSSFLATPYQGFGLTATFSDGSVLFVLPVGNNDPAEVDDPSLPAISDWELFSPKGTLSAGPGPAWSFKAAMSGP